MLLQLDFSSETPIYLQIRNQVVVGIANGTLLPGDKLPTIRALADETGINMMTVNKAYQQLKQEGYIVTDRRSGAQVSGSAAPHELSHKEREAFKVLVSEAKLKGYTKERLLRLVEQLFDEMQEGGACS